MCSQASYDGLIMKVLEVFNPGKFLMTVFANNVSVLFGLCHSFAQMITEAIKDN